jgi:hypothetical protein
MHKIIQVHEQIQTMYKYEMNHGKLKARLVFIYTQQMQQRGTINKQPMCAH